jgi:UDP-N-acetylglucosamine--N-acetylmuramyl-(pentapeptide) pyrophosphoryl-undecaprenol N-acetylglucosamine transferase
MTSLTHARFPRRMSGLNLVIAGGGTGGHLIPGIAVAQKIRALAPESNVVFLIPGKPLERSILDAHGEDYVLCGGRSPVGNPLKKLTAVVSLAAAYRRSGAFLRGLSPDAVLGVGGYGSVCGGLAARRLGIPLFLQEQNVVAGRVNRLMSRYAEAVFAQWPLERPLHKNAAIEVTGNPIRTGLGSADRYESLRVLGLSPERSTLLIMGGSQGAAPINRAFTNNLDLLDVYSDRLQIIHLTGKAEFEEASRAWSGSRVTRAVLPFASDMAPLLAAADFVVCRAGATTVSELTALAKPMALIPLPTAADNHQELNARFIQKRGAGLLIHQSDLATQPVLHELLKRTILDRRRRGLLALNSRQLGKPGAATDIALRLLNRFGVQPSSRRADSISRADEREEALSLAA